MSKKISKLILDLSCLFLSHAALMCASIFNRQDQGLTQSKWSSSDSLRRNLTKSAITANVLEDEVIRPYDQGDIHSLRYNMKDVNPMLLIFDGHKFKVFTLGHEHIDNRHVKLVPLLVHALETNHPERFKPGQPVFQLVFTASDFLLTECANEFTDCPVNKFLPPIISFSSVYRDKSIFPTAKSFPNPDFSGCMFDWKVTNSSGCQWPEVDHSYQWDDLENQIVWRGSDHPFFLPSFDEYGKMDVRWLEQMFTREALANMTERDVESRLFHHYSDLSPRWKAVALSLKSTISETGSHRWINVMFTGEAEKELHTRFAERGMHVSDDQLMSPLSMSRYKYQIDLAGGT
jgi:hypothetical protein